MTFLFCVGVFLESLTQVKQTLKKIMMALMSTLMLWRRSPTTWTKAARTLALACWVLCPERTSIIDFRHVKQSGDNDLHKTIPLLSMFCSGSTSPLVIRLDLSVFLWLWPCPFESRPPWLCPWPDWWRVRAMLLRRGAEIFHKSLKF